MSNVGEMKRLSALIALLWMSTAVAGAQGVSSGIYPMTQANAGAGLIVVGHAAVTVAPDRARVIVRLVPQVNGVTGTRSLDDSGNTLVNALRSAGVADAAYRLPLEGYVGPNSQPAVIGNINKPTRESLERMARDIVKALPPTLPGVANFQINVAYIVDDCSQAESRAQTAAIADARARAARAAAAAGVNVGPIVAINENASFPSPACGAATGGVSQTGFIGQDGYGALGVTISVNATVTFAIR